MLVPCPWYRYLSFLGTVLVTIICTIRTNTMHQIWRHKLIVGAQGMAWRALASVTTLYMTVAGQSAPPPPSFSQTSSLTTPSANAPQETALPGDTGARVPESTEDGCTGQNGAGANVPEWWLNAASIIYKFLPMIGLLVALMFLYICCLSWFRRNCSSKHPAHPARSLTPWQRRGFTPRHRGGHPGTHACNPARARRPSWAMSRFSFMGRGILWSERRRQPRHPSDPRVTDRADSITSMDSCFA